MQSKLHLEKKNNWIGDNSTPYYNTINRETKLVMNKNENTGMQY